MAANNAIRIPVRILLRDFSQRKTRHRADPQQGAARLRSQSGECGQYRGGEHCGAKPFFRCVTAEVEQERDRHGESQPDLVVAVDERSAGTAHGKGSAGDDREDPALDAVEADRQRDHPDQRLQPVRRC